MGESQLNTIGQMLPTARAYADALQAPALCFRDPELQNATTATTPLGLPKTLSGSHSIVVPLRAADERPIAVKLFTKQLPDRDRRYREIAAFLAETPHTELSQPWILPFSYAPEGMGVEGSWLPLVKMHWADGEPLTAWLDGHHTDSDAVLKVAANFLGLVGDLARLGIAHGDFHHGNILVARDLTLQLIDYDGMFVPALAGLSGAELGMPNYQSPLRAPADFGPELDRFSAHLIYLSLIIVAQDPALWERLHPPGEDYLIVHEGDLRAPATSPTLLTLERHPEASIRANCAHLREVLALPVREIPPLRGPAAAPGASLQPPPSAEWMSRYISRPALEVSADRRRKTSGFHGRRRHEAALAYAYLAIFTTALGGRLTGYLGTGESIGLCLAATLALVLGCILGWRARRERPLHHQMLRHAAQVADAVYKAKLSLPDLRTRLDELAQRQESLSSALHAAHHEVETRLNQELGRIEGSRSSQEQRLQLEVAGHEAVVKAAVDEALAPLQQPWIGEALATRTIAQARLPGLTGRDIDALSNKHVVTAADFSDLKLASGTASLVLADGSLAAVFGIGPVKAAALLAWRARCAQEAARSCPLELPADQYSMIRAAFAAEQQALDRRSAALHKRVRSLIEHANLEAEAEFEKLSEEFVRDCEPIETERSGAQATLAGAVEFADNEASVTRDLRLLLADRRALSFLHYLWFVFRGHAHHSARGRIK